jgi:hypothetical protein
MEDEMRRSKAEATLACGFLLMALAAPSSAPEAKNHVGPDFFLFDGPDSIFPLRRNHETDGLSRNPDDCAKYGCIDNGGG